MKKLLAILLAVAMLASMATFASAAELTTTSTTTLTTSVQPASYMLNIPENQAITYGNTLSYIGNVTITNGTNFAKGKNVEVTVNYTGCFEADNISTTIPFKVLACRDESFTEDPYGYHRIVKESGKSLTFYGKTDNTLKEKATESFKDENSNNANATVEKSVEALCISIAAEDWGKALAGDYTATITFNAEVVAE